MKGAKPQMKNVVPMREDMTRPVPSAPEFMSEEARRVWDELAPYLVIRERLEPLHTYQLASYCESVANFVAATACIAVEGMWYTVETRNGVQQKKTAAWGQQQEAMNAMRRDSALFGLSPVDELRMSSGNQGDLFDDILGQLKGHGAASA